MSATRAGRDRGPNAAPAHGRWLVAGLLLLAALFYFRDLLPAPHLAGSATPNGYYPLLTAGFRSGRLAVALEPDPHLAGLPDPYDPVANAPYRVHDMSYFRGHYYLYFGATPAVIFFWPIRALTGCYPSETLAVAAFLFGAVVLGALLLLALRRRCFPAAPNWALGASVACLAWATPAIFLTQGPYFYQVPIACAYFLQMAMFACLYRALTMPAAPLRWLAGASLAYGLAVGARPDYLLSGGAILGVLGWLLRPGALASGARADRPRLTRMLAAAGPAAVCGTAILAYNYLRFGSPVEFGVRYQLAAMRQVDFPTLAWQNLPPHLETYLTGPGRWSSSFPFFRPHSTHLPGALRTTLWIWLAPLAFYRGRGPKVDARATVFAAAVAWAGVSNLLLLSAFFGLTERYPPDFMGAFLLLAGLGALALTNTRRGPVAGTALTVLALASLAVAGAIFAPAQISAGPWLRAGRVLSYPVYWAQRWRQEQPGPVRLELQLPAQPKNPVEPLLETGSEADQRDWFQIEYGDGNRARLGFFHAGSGLVPGDWFPIPPDRRLLVVAQCGSLLPPSTSPACRDVAERAYAYNARRVSASVNGEERLTGAVDCYPASAGEWGVGRLRWNTPGCAREFSGQIRSTRRLPPSWLPPPANVLPDALPVELAVRFSPGQTSGQEPILLTGSGRQSDLLYLVYTGPGTLKFAFDHFGAGGLRSETVHYDAAREHALVVWLGSLAAAPPASDRWARRLVVQLDGQVLINAPENFFPARPDESLLGANPSHPSVAAPRFSGMLRIQRLVPFTELPSPDPVGRYGAVSLAVTFPPGLAQVSDPLVVTGVTGAGDFIYVHYDDPAHVTFGYDHWGVGGFRGPSIPLDYEETHRLEIVMPSLLPPGRDGAGRAEVIVRLDGQVVLSGQSAGHPSPPERIALLENPIGGSTCGPTFHGRVLAVSRPDAGP